MSEAIAIYTEIVMSAIPFAIVFALGDRIVTGFLKMAFGGKVEF